MDLRNTTIAEVCAPKGDRVQRTTVPSRVGPDKERLDSWKEIAVYLDREVRTVQRWGKHEDLPVLRQFHGKGCTVYAFKSEIDAWLASRSQTLSEPRPIQRGLKHSANGLDPSSQVMGQMFALFRLWLAIIERGSKVAVSTGVEATTSPIK